MPGFFDDMQIHEALQNQALPDLERLAENPHLRDRNLRRFDRDDPPPYESSTEEEEPMLIPGRVFPPDAFSTKFGHLMDAPLDPPEQGEVADTLHSAYELYKPYKRYKEALERENERLDYFVWADNSPATDPTKLSLRRRAGRERRNILARRNIKRRWQKLGVWNPDWGIPGRLSDPQPNDDMANWKWHWQHGSSAAEWKSGPIGSGVDNNPHHPIVRAMRLRQPLHRGEHAPVTPLSNLQDGASASQAESFIISRPWFIYRIELAEEFQRSHRVPHQAWHCLPHSNTKHVNRQWKLRGDTKDSWIDQGHRFIPGWKWPHESPSPEPEDMMPLNTSDLEFTPSEVDALEAVPPQSRPPSPRWELPPGELYPAMVQPSAYPNPFSRPASPEPDEPTLPRQRRGQRQDKNTAQPLRRSARIAAKNSNLANLADQPSTKAPNVTRPRRTGAQGVNTGQPRRTSTPRAAKAKEKAGAPRAKMSQPKSTNTSRVVKAKEKAGAQRGKIEQPKRAARSRAPKAKGQAEAPAAGRSGRGATVAKTRGRGRPRKDA